MRDGERGSQVTWVDGRDLTRNPPRVHDKTWVDGRDLTMNPPRVHDMTRTLTLRASQCVGMETYKGNSKKITRIPKEVTGNRSVRTDVIRNGRNVFARECGYSEKMSGVLWKAV